MTTKKPPRPKRTPEPIIKFASIEEARASLREWQVRLFLDDWVIDIKLEDEIIVDADGKRLSGQINFQIINKTAKIALSPLSPLSPEGEEYIFRHSQEQAIVHELLHCKIGWLDPPETMEGRHWDVCQHVLIEEMARSLIMAKYNITRGWFDNTGR